MKNVQKLISLGSSQLIEEIPAYVSLEKMPGLDKVSDLLRIKNGFYAFESALHVFPLGKADGVMDIEQWNAWDLWRYEYQEITNGLLFFAEDAFGYQFCVGETGISMFNPEDASIRHLADDIEGWAKEVLEDYEELTCYPFAHEWQKANGPLAIGRRLTFKTPLVLGGKTEMANVGDIGAIEVMRFRGELWNKIKDVPLGTPIKINIVD